MNMVLSVAQACWQVTVQAAPFLLLGLVVAGLLHATIAPRTVARYLGKGRFASVTTAAAVGIPLPLCSCAVVPVAAGLKRQGASDGAALSFLIATPETGADSIAISWALLDPVMTVVRPLAALVTAVAAGTVQNLLPDRRRTVAPAAFSGT